MTGMTPLWLDRPTRSWAPLGGDAAYDVAVVGAGVTGLLTGLLLARGGRSVVVLEGRTVGAGTTGHTTAKVSLLQGTKLMRVMRRNPPSVARAYVEANREGQAWLRRFCEDHGVAVQERAAYTYATTRVGELRARAEHAAAREAGLDVTWVDDVDLPYPTRGAVRLGEQLQLHPMELLDAIAASLEAEGGVVHEQSRVTGADREGDRTLLRTERGTVEATDVVLATSQPILDRGGYFARLSPHRSYAAAFESDWVAPGMYLSADRVTRSVRSAAVDGRELLLVGGNGHVTGRGPAPSQQLGGLVTWARGTFEVGPPTHTWSAQDQTPLTGLPYVGPLLPGEDGLFLATGFDKWGFAVAPAAALALSKRLLDGEQADWERGLRSWTPWELAGLPKGLLVNGSVGVHMVDGWLRRSLAAEEAKSPVCTHLGGVLRWNDAEESWDCPLHGSRFAPDGSVLEGPATSPAEVS